MRICLIGVGNELRGDDGIGPSILSELQSRKSELPVDLYSVGVNLFCILDIMKAYDHIFIIDAFPPGSEPGKIHDVQLNSCISIADEIMSLHDLDLVTILKWTHVELKPLVTILGIETYSIGWQIGLSSQLEIKLPGIVEAILTRVNQEIKLCHTHKT